LVATNQSGIARGLYDLEMLDAIHEKMMRELAAVGGYIEEIFFCPHHPDDLCACRKPKTGMLDAIRKKYNISLPDTFYIGDSLADVGVAEATGCKLILVMTGNGRLTIDNNPYLSIIPQFADLADAAQFVLTQQASIRG
jgi:D-glycero-D-manno-heptose 1,7-bisphosphate phosphatase